MTLSVVRLAAVLPSWKPCCIPSWAALWCSQRWPGWGRCGARWWQGCSCLLMPGFCWLGTTLSGTLGVGMPGGHCGPICACCFAVLSVCWHLRCHRVATGKVFTAAAVVGLTAAWVGRAIRLDWLRVVADLTRAHTLPSWCIIHKRFNLSQADFSKRWCLGDVLAQVSSDGTGLPTSSRCVHVPSAIAVPAEPAALAEAAASAAPVAAL